VLGQGQTSRLHKSLVRQQELAEGSGASTMGLIGGNSFGFAYARARDGVATEALEQALVAEIDRLVTDGPTETELRRAKAQYERHWLHELARVDSRADAFGEFATLEGDPGRVNTRLAEVEAVDLEAIARAADAWFSPDQRATLIYRQEQP
jgi:zinc protease